MCRQAPTPAAASSPSSPLLSACLQTKAGLKFERVGAPQPSDMASVAAERAVSAVQEVCIQRGIPPPTIVTESGRALASHHSVLVFDVLTT